MGQRPRSNSSFSASAFEAPGKENAGARSSRHEQARARVDAARHPNMLKYSPKRASEPQPGCRLARRYRTGWPDIGAAERADTPSRRRAALRSTAPKPNRNTKSRDRPHRMQADALPDQLRESAWPFEELPDEENAGARSRRVFGPETGDRDASTQPRPSCEPHRE